MSTSARHLVALRQGLGDLLAHPRNSEQWEQAVIRLDWRIREHAEFLIAWGC